jgi:hypothetical protein
MPLYCLPTVGVHSRRMPTSETGRNRLAGTMPSERQLPPTLPRKPSFRFRPRSLVPLRPISGVPDTNGDKPKRSRLWPTRLAASGSTSPRSGLRKGGLIGLVGGIETVQQVRSVSQSSDTSERSSLRPDWFVGSVPFARRREATPSDFLARGRARPALTARGVFGRWRRPASGWRTSGRSPGRRHPPAGLARGRWSSRRTPGSPRAP